MALSSKDGPSILVKEMSCSQDSRATGEARETLIIFQEGENLETLKAETLKDKTLETIDLAGQQLPRNSKYVGSAQI